MSGLPPKTYSRPSGHGTSIRGLDSVARHPTGYGRFGRMFPELPPARYADTLEKDAEVMRAIAKTMIKYGDFGGPITKREKEDENPAIPVGYTYFGQFIDHDITLDVASSLDRATDPSAVEDFRTPRLDLDCIYGRGPDDQPYLYNPDLTLKLGPDRAPPGLAAKGLKRFDVIRGPADESGSAIEPALECARALLGDKRNDENSIVVQIHALFIRVHNHFMAIERAARLASPGTTWEMAARKVFTAAQRRTRWTYQYLVIRDFVARVVGRKTFRAVWNGGDPLLKFYHPDDAVFPYMPVEFSVAAYRLGHSMVRPSYALNAKTGTGTERLPIFGPRGADECAQERNLNGFRPLPASYGIDWSLFFWSPSVDSSMPKDAVLPQPSYRLDTLLVDPLAALPDQPAHRKSLALLNLLRGTALGLPSGQAVARRMGIAPLSDDALWRDAGNLPDETDGPDPDGSKTIRANRAKLLDTYPSLSDNAPLWYYILREAEICSLDADKIGGVHLGDVGGRIVAEVFMGLLMKDDQSYWNLHRTWVPSNSAGQPKADFTMVDLVAFVDHPPLTAAEPS